MIRVVQEFGAHTGRQLSFEAPRIRLGRAPTNDVAFDPNVDLDASANHCEIVTEDGVQYVIDSNSRNGTYVNGNRVQKQRLANNDVIECGRGGPRLRIELPQPSPAPPAAPMRPMPAFQAPAPSTAGAAPTEAMPAFAVPPGTGVASPSGSYAPGFAPYAAPAMPSSPPPPFAAAAPMAGGFNGYAPTPPPVAQGGFAPPIGTAPPGMYPNGVAGPVPPYTASPGAAAVARLPPGAQVGKRTMAMMIDAALVQAGVRKTSGGLKVVLVVMIALVVSGFGAGAYFLWQERAETDARLAHVGSGGDENAGERIARDNETTIYMIASRPPSGQPDGFCSGFAVTTDLIATNAHCVRVATDRIAQGQSIIVLRNNGRGIRIPATPVYHDPRYDNPTYARGGGYDVGIVRAFEPLPSHVHLITDADAAHLTPGANIYVYGFPGMTMDTTSPVATITSGVLSRVTDFFERAADDPSQAQMLQHSAQTTHGSSGSPIFLASGDVVGVNAGSLLEADDQSYVDPRTGQRANVEINHSSNFKYGMRADLIRQAIQAVGETAP